MNQETAAATVESPEAAGAAAAAEETETAVTGTDAEETAAEDTKAEDTASAEAENDDAVVAETANQASEEVTEAADNEENVQAVSGAEAPTVGQLQKHRQLKTLIQKQPIRLLQKTRTQYRRPGTGNSSCRKYGHHGNSEYGDKGFEMPLQQ